MLTVNKHLLKNYPIYRVKGENYVVKLLRVYKTDKGLKFTTEIMSGKHKGKVSQSYKNDLKLIK